MTPNRISRLILSDNSSARILMSNAMTITGPMTTSALLANRMKIVSSTIRHSATRHHRDMALIGEFAHKASSDRVIISVKSTAHSPAKMYSYGINVKKRISHIEQASKLLFINRSFIRKWLSVIGKVLVKFRQWLKSSFQETTNSVFNCTFGHSYLPYFPPDYVYSEPEDDSIFVASPSIRLIDLRSIFPPKGPPVAIAS